MWRLPSESSAHGDISESGLSTQNVRPGSYEFFWLFDIFDQGLSLLNATQRGDGVSLLNLNQGNSGLIRQTKIE